MQGPQKINLYYINMDSAVARREAAERQALSHGLDIQRVPAVIGRELTEADLVGFDAEKRRREYHFDMTMGEHACTMSHLKALRQFLESDADMGVVLEDDFVLHPRFQEGLRWAVEHTGGWQVMKLFTDDGKLYPTPVESPDGNWRLVFPKKILWVAVGNLYTREGARRVLEGFRRYWVPFDVQLAEIMLRTDITVCGITPSLATTSDPQSQSSSIDASSKESGQVSRVEVLANTGRRSLCQYIRRRLGIWAVSRGKRRMRRNLRHRLLAK